MKALVTGGAGFIGSHLVDRLLVDGHKVIVLDNYVSGSPRNLEHLRNNASLSVHHIDIASQDEIKPLFEGVQWVFHLAGRADIVPSITNPMAYHHSNVDGTISVLEAARHAGVERFLYAASSTCYGLPGQFPTPETAPMKPMYPYALTKYIGEQYVLHWNKLYKLPCVSLRLFNVYGPRVRTTGTYGAVFGVFLAQKLAGKPFTIVGDGTQTRDFTFVADVANCFVQAAASDVDGEVFNIGSGQTYSINYLVELLGGETVHLPKRPGEPDCTFADTQKVRETLGWRPAVSLEAGVKVMLENIDLWRDAPVWDVESIAGATVEWHKYLGDQRGAG